MILLTEPARTELLQPSERVAPNLSEWVAVSAVRPSVAAGVVAG